MVYTYILFKLVAIAWFIQAVYTAIITLCIKNNSFVFDFIVNNIKINAHIYIIITYLEPDSIILDEYTMKNKLYAINLINKILLSLLKTNFSILLNTNNPHIAHINANTFAYWIVPDILVTSSEVR